MNRIVSSLNFRPDLPCTVSGSKTLRRLPAPVRFRFDPDRVVGLACVLLFPVALWLA